jgi:anti-anti-sigma regulatory factor
MQATLTGWELDVRRGPGWLLLKPATPSRDLADYYPLADELWSLLERHFIYRLAIDLDDVPSLNSHLIGQLLLLHRRIRDHDGVIRLCRLSPLNRKVLQNHGLIDRFPVYDTLEEAVLGADPGKPR